MVASIQKALNLYPDGIFGKNTEAAVKAWQAAHGLKPDGIVGPATLAMLFPSVASTALGIKKSRRKIREIIVHCSATPEGRDYTVDDIRRWHIERGWSDIGYHYVVYRDGTICDGRDVDVIGAHCTGHNTYSIGVCYIGGVAKDCKTPKDTRTNAQKTGLLHLLKLLKKSYPGAIIVGHRDYEHRKACPSFDARREYSSL